jgi:hypothetical protein
MRLSLFLLVLVLCVLAAACETDPRENSTVVRDRYVDRHTDTFTLRDRTRVIDALTSVLEEEGFELAPTDRADRYKSSIKPHANKSNEQLSIHILGIMDGTVLVQIMEVTRDEKGEVTEKKHRTDLEWLVAQRAEPDRALAVMKKANERADKVPPITRKN